MKVYKSLLKEIKTDSLALCEPFVIDENMCLKSAIANSNEKPYENLLRMAKKYGALNHYDFKRDYLNTIRKSALSMIPKL